MQDLSSWVSGLGQRFTWDMVRAQTDGATGAVETMGSSGGPNLIIIVLAVLAVLVFAFIVWRMLRPSAPSEDATSSPPPKPKKEKPDGGEDTSLRPTADTLSLRTVVEKPSEIKASDTLKDVKQKKMEKVQVSSYEEAKKELQARKAGRVKKEQKARRRREREEASLDESISEEVEEAAPETQDETPKEAEPASDSEASSQAPEQASADASAATETVEESAGAEAPAEEPDAAQEAAEQDDAAAEAASDAADAAEAAQPEAAEEPDAAEAQGDASEEAKAEQDSADEAAAAEAKPAQEGEAGGVLGALDEGWGDIDFESFSIGGGDPLGLAGDEGDAEAVSAADEGADAKAEEEAAREVKEAAEAAEAEKAAAEKAQAEAKEKGAAEASAAAEKKAKEEAERQAKADAKAKEEAAREAKAEKEAKAKADADEKAQRDAKSEAKAEAQQESKEDREGGKSLKEGLKKTRSGFISRLGNIFKRQAELDEDLLEEVEEILFTADIGPQVVDALLQKVQAGLSEEEASSPEAVWSFIRDYTQQILVENERPLVIPEKRPFVILVVGVNGVGKTTTIGKLATRYADDGLKVLMVAGDTFRAAATEQLEEWGERTEIPVDVGEDGADPASVVYAGIERGVKEGFDVVICDTAGRLTNKKNLMKELEKIGKVAGKALEGAPHETLLVLDANTGLMAIEQANMFRQVVDISGLVLTKLDGTAKGGVIIGICKELQVPVRFIGIGEGVYDLREFKAGEFVDALFM